MTVEEELDYIWERDGILRPEAVVRYAKNKETALHSRFEWNNTAAAEKYRLIQAERVIRARVTIIENGNKSVATRAFVSLPSDRNGKHGYRSVVSVLSDKYLRAELLESAMAELQAFQRKYKTLTELEPLFSAIDDAAKHHDLEVVE